MATVGNWPQQPSVILPSGAEASPPFYGPPDHAQLTPEQKKNYQEKFASKDKGTCVQCGGWHLRACRRVKRIVMRNAEEISEVEFWPDGYWDKTGIIWPEDVFDDEDEEAADARTAPAPGAPAGDSQHAEPGSAPEPAARHDESRPTGHSGSVRS